MAKLLFAGTIFTSAFLLFLVQPIVSKHILPWFGGSAAVWATCMAFFQGILLLGYAYSDWVTRRLRPRSQVLLHVALLTFSLVTLQVLADASWKPSPQEDPTRWILALLASTIGLPYFLLSTTGPLLQAWVSRTLVGAQVYRLFSLSNLASLAALISYPFLVEPRAPLALQARVWSWVYGLFVLLCLGSGLVFWRRAERDQASSAPSPQTQELQPRLSAQLLWLALPGMGSWLLVAVTNHITQNVAAIPFLWLLPLTLYLLTFVLCFESDRWYRRSCWLPLAALVLPVCAWGLHDGAVVGAVKVAIPLYASGLFLLCMLLHGELARLRPTPRWLTRFYLMVSLGGALGGAGVALLAPRVLPAYYELGMGFVIVALLMSFLLKAQRRLALAGLALAAVCSHALYAQIRGDVSDARTMSRNFYGTLMTLDTGAAADADAVRQLYHGSILHGQQYLAPSQRQEPTAYYGPDSGIGRALQRTREHGKRVGLIGLGTGTLAAYGHAGDLYRFYEINPEVIEIASREFSFMRDSAARVELVLGDARLALEKEAPNRFDVLAVDAFSGDAVPAHLLTREAMRLYLDHLADDGIVAFHVTNKYLSLAPVVQRAAREHGAHAVLIHDTPEPRRLRDTDWVLVAKSAAVLAQDGLRQVARPIGDKALTPWTDNFNNLFQVLK
jgi:hypothetical protein